MMNAGRPGASASSAVEGQAATPQRVAAALGAGAPATRSRRMVTPEASAASWSRRVAVRSSPGARPHASTTSAPSPGQRAASAAARSNAASSATTASTRAAGSSPSSRSPVAWSRPPCRSAASARSHSSGVAPPASAIATPNPAAAAASPGSAANSSCTLARGRPCRSQSVGSLSSCSRAGVAARSRRRASWTDDSAIRSCNVLLVRAPTPRIGMVPKRLASVRGRC